MSENIPTLYTWLGGIEALERLTTGFMNACTATADELHMPEDPSFALR